MNMPSTALLLYRLARGRRAATAPDPAEVGTAFGMELTLAPDPADEPAARSALRKPGRWLLRRRRP